MSEVLKPVAALPPPPNPTRDKHEPQMPTPVLHDDSDDWIDEKIEGLLTSMHGGGSRKRERDDVSPPDAVESPKKRIEVPRLRYPRLEKPIECHFCGRSIWSRHSFHNHMSQAHRDAYQELRNTHGVDEIMNLGFKSRTTVSSTRPTKRVHFSPCEPDTRPPPVRSNVSKVVFVNEPLTQADIEKGTFITVPIGTDDDDEGGETESDEADYQITELSDDADKAKDLIPAEVSSTPWPKKRTLVRTRKLYSDIVRSLEELDEEHHAEKERHLAAKIAEHRRHVQFKESFAPRYRALLLELGCHTYMSIDDPLK